MYTRIRRQLVLIVRAGTVKLAVAEHDAVDGEHRALEFRHGIRPDSRWEMPGDTLRDKSFDARMLGRVDEIANRTDERDAIEHIADDLLGSRSQQPR